MTTTYLIILVTLAIFLLLLLIMKLKMNAFIALLLVSIFTGIGAGMPPQELLKTIQDGMGGILGFVAIVVGLGSIFGEFLSYSGGAEVLATDLVKRFGKDKSSYALVITGFLVSIPVFFDVGFIILAPVVYGLAKSTNRSTVYYAVPLLTGLAITHTFIPPTPGPVAVAEVLGADIGTVILLGAGIGLPVGLIVGPYAGKLVAKYVKAGPPSWIEIGTKDNGLDKKPSFAKVMFIISTPIILIILGSVSRYWNIEQPVINETLQFLGHPFIALIIGTLLSMYYLGFKLGGSKEQLLEISTKALGPAGLIILITGAGGVFKQVLVDSGVGNSLAELLAETRLPILLLAYLMAVVVRVTQGSATVAMITAAGLISPIISMVDISETHIALTVLSIAAGATTLSHVNDSGFWLIGKYLDLSEKETIQTWTTTSTAISIVSMFLILLVSLFI